VKAIYALYRDGQSAQRAVDGLRAAGIGEGDIAVMSGEPMEEFEFGRFREKSRLWYVASGGGLVGLAFGTFLTTFTQTAWPLRTGNMPIVTWWSNLVIMFEMTMLGAIVATVIGLLITARLPGRRTLYDPAVTDGQILVGVEHPRMDTVPDVQRALRAAGASVKMI
jgi:Protein of unknown function (DUF3341)